MKGAPLFSSLPDCYLAPNLTTYFFITNYFWGKIVIGKKLAVILSISIAAQFSIVHTISSDDSIVTETCNQTDGSRQTVHTHISSYRIKDLVASRNNNNIEGTTTREARVWLYGKVSGGNLKGKKAFIIWNFAKDNDANKVPPKCTFVSGNTVKITIPYGYWQIPILMNLLSTMPSHGINCAYESSADKSNARAICNQHKSVNLPFDGN